MKKEEISLGNGPTDKNENAQPANNQNPGGLRGDNTEKNPDDWVTGDEPITGAQRSYLKTLSDEAGVAFDENITKAEASKRIEELQQQTGRGAQ